MDPDELQNTASVALPRSLAAWGTPEFKETFEEELSDLSGELTIGSDGGGWLQDGSAEFVLNSVEDDRDQIYAKVMALFDVDTASACADITFSSSHRADLEVTIDKESGEAEVEVVDSEEIPDDDDEEDDMDIGECELDLENRDF